MKTKNKPRVYNDGVCYIVCENKSPSSFAARENGTTAEDFAELYRLMFADVSIREQDLDFAEAIGRSLNRKIKTPLVNGVNARQKVIISNVLYDVVNADIDRSNSEIYLYLEEVRELVET